MSKLVDINGLSKEIGIPVRKLRSFVAARKIPFLKCGHRTLLFDPQKVERELARFEVPAVGAKRAGLIAAPDRQNDGKNKAALPQRNAA
jgi:hypothetical protein